ncbi:spore coat protein [Metabacillus sp. KIGAM252]|uniref:Spore coat protein n=1 Tax=Metabacillus flavus TaxID=2823519 RepID=A0ABS5LCF4_9BACI|nr:spore coat protein [Metabacillus flavus]MBS2968417.1 spore coat protein [Metabacillus flavus]
MSKENLNEISAKLMQLFVSDVFSKNNITDETKKELSEDQKAKIKAVVLDLQAKVDEFLAAQNKKAEEAEKAPVETPKNTTLRDMLKNKKNND